jgi:hypothetical protein
VPLQYASRDPVPSRVIIARNDHNLLITVPPPAPWKVILVRCMELIGGTAPVALLGLGAWSAHNAHHGMFPSLFLMAVCFVGIAVRSGYRVIRAVGRLGRPPVIRFVDGILSVDLLPRSVLWFDVTRSQIGWINCRPVGWVPGFQTFLLLEVGCMDGRVPTARIPWPVDESMVAVENALRDVACPLNEHPHGELVTATHRAIHRRQNASL